MRPRNERERDRIVEKRIMKRLASLHEYERFEKLPESYFVDFAVFDDNGLAALWEVKYRRDYPSTAFDEVLISALKVWHGRSLAATLKVPLFFSWGWNDGVITTTDGFADWTKIEWAGRKDRGQEGDMEPCCFFSLNGMERWKND